MPALYLFGTRTLLGGDDLQISCYMTLIGRLLQCLFLILPLAVFLYLEYQQQQQQQRQGGDNSNSDSNSDGETSCYDNQRMNGNNVYPLLSMIWVAISFAFCMMSILVEVQLWYYSCQGTPTTIREPRTSHVRRWMQFKLMSTSITLMILSVLFVITSTGFAKQYHQHNIICHYQQQPHQEEESDTSDNSNNVDKNDDVTRWVSSQSWYILSALLFVTQLMECILTTLILARLTCPCMKVRTDHPPWNEGGDGVFLPHDPHHIAIHHLSHHHHEKMEELWARRCISLFRFLSCCTCFVFGGKDLWMIPISTTNAADHEDEDTNNNNNNINLGGATNANTTNTNTTTTTIQTHNSPFRIYQQVAQVLADYMETRGTLDVVPTDWVTGLLVLQRLQRLKFLQQSRQTRLQSLGVQFHNYDQEQRLNPQSNNTIAPTSSDQTSSGSSLLVQTNHNDDASGPPATTATAATSSGVSSLLQQEPTTTTSNNTTTNDTLSSEHEQQELIVLLEEAARMAKYALAIYTWKLYVLTHPCTGFSTLSYRSCCNSNDMDNSSRDGGGDAGGGIGSRGCCCCRRWNRQRENSIRIRRNTNNNDRSFPVPASPITIQRQYTQEQQQSSSSMHLPRNSAREHDLLEQCHDKDNNYNNGNDNHINENDEIEDGHDHEIQDEDDENDPSYDPPSMESGTSSKIIGDTFCQWHKHALLSVAGLQSDHDLIYAQFRNELSFVPYCILLDHEHALVVVSIRGSLSLEDIVINTMVQPEPLERIGVQYGGFDGKGQYCHAGVLSCAETILQDLHHHRWLDRLLLQEYPTYQLRIVGHSLGAGVAVLLSYVLRWKFPTLHVYSFSPPGCTMTWKMATDCIPWTTSFVLDNDIVPRLSVLSLETLRDEILELIGRIKVPKYKVFDMFLRGNNGRKGCLFRNISGDGSDDTSFPTFDVCEDEEELEDLTHMLHDILDGTPQDTLYNRQVQEFFQVQHFRKQTRGVTSYRHILFYPPGRIIHLKKTKTANTTDNYHGRKFCCSCCCCSSSCSHMLVSATTSCTMCCCGTSDSVFIYSPVYIANDEFRNEIVVHGTMGTDHLMARMCEELQKVVAAAATTAKDYNEE